MQEFWAIIPKFFSNTPKLVIGFGFLFFRFLRFDSGQRQMRSLRSSRLVLAEISDFLIASSIAEAAISLLQWVGAPSRGVRPSFRATVSTRPLAGGK